MFGSILGDNNDDVKEYLLIFSAFFIVKGLNRVKSFLQTVYSQYISGGGGTQVY